MIRRMNYLKEMLNAYQAGKPLPGTLFVPTLDDLSSARKKVREAAAVMGDLAVDPNSNPEP